MIEMMQSMNPRVITRAIHYLFNKETLSPWKVEREYLSQQKAQRYIEQLKACSTAHTPTKSDHITWQNLIIDDRFQESDYRKIQNYVGYMMRDFIAHVECIPPKPEDIPDLMDGLLQLPLVDYKFPVILAAIYSFGFVFIHPFRDGNGRLHRLLLHTILAQKNHTPKGMIFPFSATMLKHIADYEEILQCYSRPLMKFIDYQFISNNQLRVLNNTAFLYRSWDMTDLVEHAFQCIEKTIDEEFCEEITYLNGYDKTFSKIQSHTPLSEREIDLIICCIVQNSGRLAKEKRRNFFSMLSDADIKNCEKAVTLYLKAFYSQN